MAKLKFTGLVHERVIQKADFSRNGFEDQGLVRFNADNNWVAELDDDAAQWLMETDAEFRLATEKDETEQDVTRVGAVPRSMPKRSSSNEVEADPEDNGEQEPNVADPKGQGELEPIDASPGAVGTGRGASGTRSRGRSAGRAT